MSKWISGFLAVSFVLVALPSSADQTVTETVIHGRPNKPSVVIELARPTAARAAGVAHQEMHARLVNASAPLPKAR